MTRNKLIDENPYWNYIYECNREQVTTNLWSFAYIIIKNANWIKNIDPLKTLDLSQNATEDSLKRLAVEYAFDHYIDSVRIITCFENYMKGQLVINKFLVHELVSNHVLNDKQRKRPISISEIAADLETALTKNTIQFSTLLKGTYQEIIDLPLELLNILRSINLSRNKVHFANRIEFEIGKKVLDDFDKIINFVDSVIKPKIDQLDTNMDRHVGKTPVIDI